MEFEDIEVGLINENPSLPDKGVVLKRFHDGLKERLRADASGESAIAQDANEFSEEQASTPEA